jgi:hypothetical protein
MEDSDVDVVPTPEEIELRRARSVAFAERLLALWRSEGLGARPDCDRPTWVKLRQTARGVTARFRLGRSARCRVYQRTAGGAEVDAVAQRLLAELPPYFAIVHARRFFAKIFNMRVWRMQRGEGPWRHVELSMSDLFDTYIEPDSWSEDPQPQHPGSDRVRAATDRERLFAMQQAFDHHAVPDGDHALGHRVAELMS